jgi:site-specific recombinase XerC
LSAGTVTRIHATLRAALNAALRRGLIAWNPAREAEPPRRCRPRAAVWTDDLLNRGLCFISHQIQRRGQEILQGPPKTPTSVRAVALDRTTVKALKAHRRRQETECRAAGVVPSGFVFTRLDGQPFAPEYLYRRFVKLVAKYGLPPIRLHDLRHGAASLALQAGVDLKVVSDQLGHPSIVITADTYISVLPVLAMNAAEATARLVVEAGKRAPGSKKATRRKPGPPNPSGRGQCRRRRLRQ